MADPRKHWTSSSGAIELAFTRQQLASIPQIGQCETQVFNLMHQPSIIAQTWTITDATLRNVLAEYGAWTEEELCCRFENIQRVIWVAICDIREEYAIPSKVILG